MVPVQPSLEYIADDLGFDNLNSRDAVVSRIGPTRRLSNFPKTIVPPDLVQLALNLYAGAAPRPIRNGPLGAYWSAELHV